MMILFYYIIKEVKNNNNFIKIKKIIEVKNYNKLFNYKMILLICGVVIIKDGYRFIIVSKINWILLRGSL